MALILTFLLKKYVSEEEEKVCLMFKRTRKEQKSERTNEQTNERINKRMNERVEKCTEDNVEKAWAEENGQKKNDPK